MANTEEQDRVFEQEQVSRGDHHDEQQVKWREEEVGRPRPGQPSSTQTQTQKKRNNNHHHREHKETGKLDAPNSNISTNTMRLLIRTSQVACTQIKS